MKCRICGNMENASVFTFREMMMGLREEFTYFRCSACNCLQMKTFPDDMFKYYGGNYYSHQEKEDQGWITSFIKKQRDRYAVLNNSWIGNVLYSRYPKEDLRALSYINPDKDAAILDVGCGRGTLLQSLSRLGFTDLMGIDPFNKEKIIDINGTKIYKKNLSELDGAWDLIMLHHVFEHMADPAKTLQHISSILSPGGSCLIRIPVAGCFAWEKFKEHWVQLDPPRHFFIHSPQSIQYLLQDTDLELQQIVYDSTAFQFWGSIQYEKDIPLKDARSYAVNPAASAFSPQEIHSFAEKAEELNRTEQGDQALFILQRTR